MMRDVWSLSVLTTMMMTIFSLSNGSYIQSFPPTQPLNDPKRETAINSAAVGDSTTQSQPTRESAADDITSLSEMLLLSAVEGRKRELLGDCGVVVIYDGTDYYEEVVLSLLSRLHNQRQVG